MARPVGGDLGGAPLKMGGALMDFKQHVPLGRTGLMVSRLGIASGYGVPAAAMEKAFH